MPSFSTCEDEIVALHEFFVEWYAGSIPREQFKRLEQALAPDFEMIPPDGERRSRTEVLEGIRTSYSRNSLDEFDIDIRHVEMIHQHGRCATVRYEEWQDNRAEQTGRISTVLFQEDPQAPGGVRWLDLHETWLTNHGE